MNYEYQDIQTGEVVEIIKSASKCDPLGKVITHNSRKVRRILSSNPVIGVMDEQRVRHNLPKWLPGAPAYNKKGYPIISNAEGRNMGLVENPHLDRVNGDD